MQKLDITNFLSQQKFLKFDYLFATVKKSKSGKNDKIPMKAAKGFTDPSVRISDTKIVENLVKDPSNIPYDLVGLILKSEEGLEIMGKKVIVIDIDSKEDPDRGEEIFEDVVDYFVSNFDLDRKKILEASERTISGGYHIFISSNKLYPQQNLYIEDGVAIELFSENRYIATAPSFGYTALSGDDCVDLSKSLDLEVSTMDLDHFCKEFVKEEKEKSESGLNINDDFLFDDKNFDRVTKKWSKYNSFMNGSTDRDWDNISDRADTYDYIRHNIMPIMALFDKTDVFLDKIKEYGTRYVKQWKNYPGKWLEDYNNDTVILGKDARTRLQRVGLFKKKSGDSRQEIINDFVNNQMPVLFESVMLVYQAIYYYSEVHKCFVYLEKPVFNNIVGLHYKENLGKILPPEQYATLYDTFAIYASIFAANEKYPNYVTQNLVGDRTYKSNIPIAFRNGTLYLTGNGKLEFKKDYWSYEDQCMFTIQLDFEQRMLKEKEDSIIYDWFRTKFSEKDLDFIQMFFGNLLVPSYSPSIMLVLYSYKGALGKSTLAKTLQSLFDIDSKSLITSLPISKLSARFGGDTLSRSLLNMTTELDGRIDSESFKSVISREKWQVEAKYENTKYQIPLAKHISMSNDVPKVLADGGVVRRLGVFKLKEEKAMTHIEPSRYEQLFIQDAESLLTFMLIGLKTLQSKGFCDLSNYYLTHFKDHVKDIREYNSNVFEWLGVQGLEIIDSKTEEDGGISSSQMYETYKIWCNGQDLDPVRKRTVMKYVLSSENITEDWVKDERLIITK